jgi:hypothetical protein
MEHPQYDEGQWPIVLVTMPEHELSDADLLLHIDRLSAFSKRGQRFVQIIDVRGAGTLSAEARRVIAERLDQDEEAYPGILIGVAIVLATPLHRGIFKALSWLTRNPRPFESFSDVDGAKQWARGLLGAQASASHIRVSAQASDSKRVG